MMVSSIRGKNFRKKNLESGIVGNVLLTIISLVLLTSSPSRIYCNSYLHRSRYSLGFSQRRCCPIIQCDANNIALPNNKYYINRQPFAYSFNRLSAVKSKTKKSNNNNDVGTPYKLVIVESPAKAKTIERILTSMKFNNNKNEKNKVEKSLLQNDFIFLVEACFGHIRDLPTSAKYVPEIFKTFSWSTLGVDVENNYTPLYVPLPGKENVIDNLCSMVLHKNCLEVILATDEDREGEAISWHLHQFFLDGRATTDLSKDIQLPPMRRVTFNEITPKALEEAFLPIFDEHEKILDTNIPTNTKKKGNYNISLVQGLNMNLVEAQECRRIVDRLAGYSMSPVLWKKITPGLSAGRVQTVGLQLVVKRELERMKFKSSEYWNLAAYLQLQNQDKALPSTTFLAKLSTVQGKHVASGRDFNGTTGLLKDDGSHSSSNIIHLTEETCKKLQRKLSDAEWVVQSVSSKQIQRSPPAPFITSTLQQEANNKLGFSVSDTMRTAQVLYEAGYITYMRTDNPLLSEDGSSAADLLVKSCYGEEYLVGGEMQLKRKEKKKKWKTENLNTIKRMEEAHEAIRPAIYSGTFIEPSKLELHSGQAFSTASKQLYELIYRRTCASRMRDMVLNQTYVTVSALSADFSTQASFTASGSVIIFEGYTRALGSLPDCNDPVEASNTADSLDTRGGTEDKDARNSYSDMSNIDGLDEASSKELPKGLTEGAELTCSSLESLQHHTNPPARFTEASFVKELERIGVGRPSTYAIIISTLRSRAYVGTPTSHSLSAAQQKRNIAHGSKISAQRAAGGADFMGSNRGPLVPSLTAFVVCSLLERYCPTFVDPAFTAEMELKLDIIAKGSGCRFSYLSEYYEGQYGLKKNVTKMMDQVKAEDARRVRLPSLDNMQNGLIPNHLKKSDSDDNDIGLFIGPWGPYVQRLNGKSNKMISAPLPLGMAANISSLSKESLVAILHTQEKDGIVLGTLPQNGKKVRLKVGRFGAYLQVGETGEKNTTTHTLPRKLGGMGGRHINVEETGLFSERLDDETENTGGSIKAQYPSAGLTFEQAIGYVNLPRTISELNGYPLIIGLGRYGPYLKFNETYFSIPNEVDVLNIDMERAVQLLQEAVAKSKTRKKSSIAFLGEKEGGSVEVCQGKFGFYIKWKNVNSKLPVEFLEKPSDMPLEVAWSVIQEKANKRLKIGAKPNKSLGREKLAALLPPKPKRPLTSFLFFCAEKREELMNSTKSLGKASKELSQLWLNLDNKSYYESKASVARKNYEEKKQIWEEECNAIQRKYLSGSSKISKISRIPKKDTSASNGSKSMAVKKPISAYLHFAAAYRSEVSKSFGSFGEISKELSYRWRNCDNNTKKIYEDIAIADKMRYEQELARLQQID